MSRAAILQWHRVQSHKARSAVRSSLLGLWFYFFSAALQVSVERNKAEDNLDQIAYQMQVCNALKPIVTNCHEDQWRQAFRNTQLRLELVHLQSYLTAVTSVLGPSIVTAISVFRSSNDRLVRSGASFAATSVHTNAGVRMLRETVDGLARECGVQPTSIDVWVVRDMRTAPSMRDQAGRMDLYVPMGLLVLLKRSPGAARFFLAHELGHKIQGDSGLWLTLTSFAAGTIAFALPFQIAWGGMVYLSLGGKLDALPLNDGDAGGALLSAWSTLTCIGATLGVWRARRRAELHADVFASALAGTEGTKDALLTYLSNEWSMIHVSKWARWRGVTRVRQTVTNAR